MKNINTEKYEQTLQMLKFFFEKEFSIKIDKLNENQTLDEFGVDADDMYDLLIKLSKEFDFNLDNFNEEKYINNEPTILTTLYSIINFLFKTDYNEKDKEPITIKMIALSSINKSWLY